MAVPDHNPRAAEGTERINIFYAGLEALLAYDRAHLDCSNPLLGEHMGDISKAPRGAIGVRLCSELEGRLMAVKADGLVPPDETAPIAGWLQANDQFADTHPFRELAGKLNPHWAFSCYGRKVEKAFERRRAGHKVLIVHESDFWDALVR